MCFLSGKGLRGRERYRTLKIEILYSKWFFRSADSAEFWTGASGLRRRQQGACLVATFPWNTDIHGRFIDKRGKPRGDFYAGIKDRLQHTEKG